MQNSNCELIEETKKKEKLNKALKKLRQSSMSNTERIEDPSYLPWVSISRKQ